MQLIVHLFVSAVVVIRAPRNLPIVKEVLHLVTFGVNHLGVLVWFAHISGSSPVIGFFSCSGVGIKTGTSISSAKLSISPHLSQVA